jgi:hypothetical protein
MQPAFPTNPNTFVHNLSTVNLNQLQMEALSLGLKFCIPPKKVNSIETQAQFERFFEQLSKETAASTEDEGWLKAKLVDIERQYRITPSCQSNLLTADHIRALKELRSNENIIILNPDKGSGVVLLDMASYCDKMKPILDDRTKFVPDDTDDNTATLEQEVSREIQLLLEGHFISEDLARTLRPRGTQMPQMYGLPKIHKPNVPLRPILSMKNSPQHELAKWLAKTLEPVRESMCRRTIKDSFEIAHVLDCMNIRDKFMSSMDVTSLFTNVPLHETIQTVCDHIEREHLNVGIPPSELYRLLLLCTSNIKFRFRNKGYRQIDGIGMGSPLGPLLADIFMASLENAIQDRLNEICLYRRYVDDILLITNSRQQAEEIMNIFNELHPNIKLTMELESNNSLAFLDLLLKRSQDGSIQRSVYRKATWSGQYLHFHSFAPIRYKRGLVKTLFERARKLCTEDTLGAEMRFLKNTLRENGYPSNFISKFSKPKTACQPVPTVEKKKVFLKLPFRGDDVGRIISNRLNAVVAKVYHSVKVFVVYGTIRIPTTPVKQPLPSYAKSHLLYQFQCGSCNVTYIGRTERQLHARVAEHIPQWVQRIMDHPNGTKTRSTEDVIKNHKTPSSSIARHLITSRHNANPQTAFKVIYATPDSRLLKFAEAVAIKKFKPRLCVQKDLFVTLSLPW